MTERDISTYPEDAQTYIRELREEAKANRIRATANQTEAEREAQRVAERDAAIADASAKLTEFDKIKTDLAALQDIEARRLASQASDALQNLKLAAAKEAGIPDFADRLEGADADALKADAVALKAVLDAKGGAATFDRTQSSTAGPVQPPSELDSLTAFIATQLQETE